MIKITEERKALIRQAHDRHGINHVVPSDQVGQFEVLGEPTLTVPSAVDLRLGAFGECPKDCEFHCILSLVGDHIYAIAPQILTLKALVDSFASALLDQIAEENPVLN